jgi:P27 family predicted phage terminase small subunit
VIMARPGRRPTPTALKVARGNPGKRALNHDEPEFEPLGNEPPADLKDRARQEWERLAAGLSAAGVLTVADLSCFETYCRLVAEEAFYQGKSAKHDDDATQKLKYDSHLLKVRAQKKLYMAELGLTPSSRSGVKARKPVDPADEKRKRFLSIPGGMA